jgi:serine/threonine-protein kinase
MPLTNGETFAGYRIVRLLGSGGMGEVYLAEHPRLPRRDALKVLRADVSADAEYRTRFIREADLASNLWHPHIVSVHDRGEYNGQLWISMDYVDGLDAARRLAKRYPAGMPVDEVVRIVTAVASALDYAHKQGLLHRDVKPANIMLTRVDEDDEQRILLADFGVARNIEDISGLTTTNMTVGTVAYSAPEQLMGEEIDGRADQYALAATAYHLLIGSQLFPHSNPAVVISRHLNSPPPAVADTRSDLAALDPVLKVALAKDPEDRFTRCADFAKALAEQSRAATTSDPTATTTSAPITQKASRSRARWRVIAAVIGVVVLAGAAVLIWPPWQEGSSTATATSSVTSPPVITTTQPSGTTSIAPPASAMTTTPSPAPVPAPSLSTPTPSGPSPAVFVVPGTRYAFPAHYDESDPIREMPTNLRLNVRFYQLTDLTWTAWGPGGAEGSGSEFTQTDCDPTCTEGTHYRVPVRIHAFNPQPPQSDSGCPAAVAAVLFYSEIVLTYVPTTAASPPRNPSGKDFQGTTDNGLPAVRYWNRVPHCDPVYAQATATGKP